MKPTIYALLKCITEIILREKYEERLRITKRTEGLPLSHMKPVDRFFHSMKHYMLMSLRNNINLLSPVVLRLAICLTV